MALVKGRLGKVGDDSSLKPNEAFLSALQSAIVGHREASTHSPSNKYSPSGLSCMRQMWYKRRGFPQSATLDSYMDVSMASTGTLRHEAIQEALLWMNQHSRRFLYIDVAEYVKKKQEQGKCLQLAVTGTHGAETALYDKERHISFRCDGIIYDALDKHFYLFEFKNQISYKAVDKAEVDVDHYAQVFCYCDELHLEDAFVVYENRDSGQLYIPEVFHVTEYNKQTIREKIDKCEHMAVAGILPERPKDISPKHCQWCRYRRQCAADGPESRNCSNIAFPDTANILDEVK